MSATEIVPPEGAFPLPEFDEAGIDRSQIRLFLELTPLERVGKLVSMLASIDRIRHGTDRTAG